jgi:ABC-type nitrate/sulfonate/bicarbonate transport system substrate-binding protein
MINLRRRIGFVVIMVVAVTALAACGSSAKSSTSSSRVAKQGAAGETTIRIGWLAGTEAPMYAAQAVHAFRKVGLNAKFIQFSDGPAMNAAFKIGAIDVGYSGAPGFLTALETGTAMQWFAIDGYNDHEQGLVANPRSGITSVKSLAGKIVAAPLGTTAWMGLLTALKENGMSLSDIHYVNLAPAALLPAYLEGHVQAVYIYAPLFFDLEAEGARVIQMSYEAPTPSDISGYFGRESWMKSHPAAVVKFLEALQIGLEAIKSDPSRVIAFMSKDLSLPKSVVAEELKYGDYPSLKQQLASGTNYSMTSSGGIEAVLKHYVKTMVSYGLLSTAPDINGVVNSSYLRMAISAK